MTESERRDYFIGQSLSALMVHPTLETANLELVARAAVRLADAVIAEAGQLEDVTNGEAEMPRQLATGSVAPGRAAGVPHLGMPRLRRRELDHGEHARLPAA